MLPLQLASHSLLMAPWTPRRPRPARYDTAWMLLNPEEPAQLRQRVTLQILQQKLADPANFPDEPPDNDPPPFDLKLRYYIELKTQDALDRARQATDEGAADALARLVANRRQMLGPWTPRCPPYEGPPNRCPTRRGGRRACTASTAPSFPR